MKQRLINWASLLFVLSSLIALFAMPATAASTSSLSIKSMKVSIWPEYDDSRILVIYQGEFNDGSAFPQDIGFPVPTGSEISQACALEPPDDVHLCQLFEKVDNGATTDINYNLPIPTYYLEYYWDGISASDGGAKTISFRYDSPYEIDSLTIDVQQPARSSGFSVDQPGASQVTDSQGLNYYRYTFDNVAPGQTIDLDASYVKTDNRPSFDGSQAAAPGGASSASGGGTNYGWVIGLLGAAAIVTGFIVFRRRPVATNRAQARRAVRNGRTAAARPRPQPVQAITRQPAAPRTAPPARPTPTATAAKPAAGVSFCPYCGTKLADGAAFCHGCGAELKDLG